MRIFTKSFLTFLLLCVAGIVNAGQETLIMEQDYSTAASYPYWWMGDRVDNNPNQPYFCNGTATVEIVDGALKIDNTVEQANNWDLQPFILDWFNLKSGNGYKVVITMKSSADGSANLSIGTWSASMNAGVSFKATNDFVEVVGNVESSSVATSGSDAHVLFQMGKFVGTVEIKKVQIYEIGHNWTFDIPTDVLKGAAMKVYPAQDPSDVEPTNGIYTCEAPAKVANPWDTQFWVVAKEAIPAGTPVRVTFDYKADAAHTTGPQTFRGPGDYIGNINGQDVTFAADWKTATVEFNSPSNDFQSMGLSLTLDDADNTYYFRNLKMIIAKELEDGETVEDGYIKKGMTFSTEWYCNAKWDEASKTLTWGTYVAADSEFPSPAWTFMTMDGVSGDITKWNQLHLNVSDFDNALEYKLRVVFKENDGSNPPSGPTVEVDATPDGKGNIDIDLAKLDWSKCDRTKIQDVTIYGLDRIDATKNASVKVNEAWLTTKPAEAKPDGPASIDPAIDDADPAVVANKAALLTAITKGKNADLTNKTSASKKALADAIAEGEAQLASKNTTIAKIDAARRAILQAIDELENRPAPIAAIAVPEGWRSVITNGTLEGDDMSCFFSKTSGGAPEPSVAVDYEGVDDWKAIVINSTASTASQDWDDQFFIKATEKLAVGTKYRVEFDYRSDIEGAADTQTHNQPSEYIHWACINSVTFKPEWQHHKFEGTVSNDQTGNFQTVAFNMSKNRKDTKFVIDNIVFLVEDTTTGIKSVENNTGDVQYFDLQGRRVAQPAKGLYIKNGRKVMVK